VIYQVAHGEPDLTGITGLPADLADLITGCLAKDPAARPAVADLLTRLGTPGPGSGFPPPLAGTTRASRSQPPGSPYNRGLDAKDRGDLDAACDWFAQAAAHGYAGAMYALGLTEEDRGRLDAALSAYDRAAASGDAAAAYAAGLLERQRGNVEAARRWLTQAAARGQSGARRALQLLASAR
jgi:TPR repeat protein